MRAITLGDTIYGLFTTRQYSTGAPATLGGTPVLSVYEQNNTTQITSGVSVSADYDTVTGLNQWTVVATSGNGYEAGKTYDIVITTGTVDSVSVVGEVVGSFRVKSVAEDAQDKLANAIYGSWATISTTTGNTTGRINVTDIFDAQVADADLVGMKFVVYDNTNGQWCEVIATSVQSARLLNVATTAAGDVMDFTVAAGDYVIPVGFAAMQRTADDILTDTGTTIPGVLGTPAGADLATDIAANQTDLNTIITNIAALNDLSAADILTTALTESYGTDGSALTLSQLLYLIYGLLGDFDVSGTTLTVRQLDGTTAAATFTLDSGTSPTDITRAS